MDYKILIVEDEDSLREVLCDFFLSRGDVPFAAPDGFTGLGLAEEQEFAAVLLDIMMPGLDGYGVCRTLRRKTDVPIVFLTALSDEDDKLHGYELGADDYVTKPFSMTVLYAKLSALIRRQRGNMLAGDLLEAGPLSIRLSTRKVSAAGFDVSLTPKEYALLECLMRNRNMVLSREQLLVKCWGDDYDGDVRAVDTHIRRLRDKLGKHAVLIKTVLKAGYCLEI